jgi:hypothetical protein
MKMPPYCWKSIATRCPRADPEMSAGKWIRDFGESWIIRFSLMMTSANVTLSQPYSAAGECTMAGGSL